MRAWATSNSARWMLDQLEGIPTGFFDATLVRWGIMYMDSPVAALVGARRAMIPGGRVVAAVWAEPERVPYFTFPRRLLEKYRSLPAIDLEAPGTFRYSDPERLRRDFQLAGLQIEHVEELDIPVMEAETDAELVEWVRAFGLTRLLNDLPENVQRSWEEDLVREAEAFREGNLVRLGGVTRIFVGRCEPPQGCVVAC